MPAHLLDTNVLSELMRSKPDPTVVSWFDRNKSVPCYVSVVTRAEIMLGIALLPEGRRRTSIAHTADRMFSEDFPGRCLGFDEGTADVYALLVAARILAGRPISTEDAVIAATALVHGLQLVTRNVSDFGDISGLELINPWRNQ